MPSWVVTTTLVAIGVSLAGVTVTDTVAVPDVVAPSTAWNAETVGAVEVRIRRIGEREYPDARLPKGCGIVIVPDGGM